MREVLLPLCFVFSMPFFDVCLRQTNNEGEWRSIIYHSCLAAAACWFMNLNSSWICYTCPARPCWPVKAMSYFHFLPPGPGGDQEYTKTRLPNCKWFESMISQTLVRLQMVGQFCFCIADGPVLDEPKTIFFSEERTNHDVGLTINNNFSAEIDPEGWWWLIMEE